MGIKKWAADKFTKLAGTSAAKKMQSMYGTVKSRSQKMYGTAKSHATAAKKFVLEHPVHGRKREWQQASVAAAKKAKMQGLPRGRTGDVMNRTGAELKSRAAVRAAGRIKGAKYAAVGGGGIMVGAAAGRRQKKQRTMK